MDYHGMAQHVLLEQQTLDKITAALRATIGWKYQGADLKRNVSSLRFVGKSYRRHFKRLVALEEEGGYMAAVLEARPESSDEVAKLHAEHAEFRKRLRRILSRLRRMGVNDRAEFAAVCGDLSALLDRIDAHNRQENGLLQEALLRDEGGEG